MHNYQERLITVLERIATALEAKNKRSQPQPISKDPTIFEFLKDVPLDVQKMWVEVFKDKIWIEGELKRAAAWWVTNPGRRRPGDTVARFALSWLQRQHENLKNASKTDQATQTPKEKPADKPKGQAFDFEFDENGRVNLTPRDRTAALAPWEK